MFKNMNPIADEMKSYLGSAEMTDEEFIEHYGMPRRSGRYPWGSGKDPYQRTGDFLARVEELKRKGWKETPENIMREFGLSSTDYRREKSICNGERRMLKVARAKALKEEGKGASEIGRIMGLRESSVRNLLDADAESRMLQCKKTADFLKERVKEDRMIDVGAQAEREINITRTQLDNALYMLQREGYGVYSNRIPQATNPNQMTTQKVLCDPSIKPKPGNKVPQEIFDYANIKTLTKYISRDGGETFEKKFTYPSSLDSKRLKIKYKEDGGEEMDGIVELRRGVQDLDLKGSRYAQVRILVDNTHYIKGMAIYADDLPDGVDVRFNSNKPKGSPLSKVLKEIKDDPDNPFGSTIKDADQGGQYWYTDAKTGKKKLGLINKTRDEGDWSEWADALPSQFLSKQSQPMAKKQLDLAKAHKEAEYDEIMSLNNPTLRKYYLDKFASSCDGAAADLKAASLPGQKYHVIVPVNSLKDTEVYAPQYKPGSKLALIRYPHGGIFEIPILTVTDKNAIARKIIGTDSNDAICINSKVAAQLSGADFDGDTVMCIPTHDRRGRVKIASKKGLEGLKDFDPKVEYGPDPDKTYTDSKGVTHYFRSGREYKPMKEGSKGTEMGVISNLITDMTLFGAPDDEIARAVRHSMVVIDAPKHKLDYKQSFIDNDIASLKKTWQKKYDKNGNLIGEGGAATIVSRSKGDQHVPKRKGEAHINIKGSKWYDPNKPEGSLIYAQADDKSLYYVKATYNRNTYMKKLPVVNGKPVEYDVRDSAARAKYEPIMRKDKKTGEVYFTNKDGSIKYKRTTRTITSTRMAETDDAYTLVSKRKHPMEILYADYANHMKALANKARIEMVRTEKLKKDPTAAKNYKDVVAGLEAKLNDALKNKSLERHAQRMTTVDMQNKKSSNPDLKGEDYRKASQRSLTKNREEVGAVSRRERSIKITDKEWEAIQAGAISNNKLKIILDNCDPDTLRERAMPKATNTLSQAQVNRIKLMANSNFTLEQIAQKMGKSPSTISKYLKGAK